MRDSISKTAKNIQNFDEEARSKSRTNSFFILLPIGILIIIWLAIIGYIGWEYMEPWTYALALASFFISYSSSAWYLDEPNPVNPIRTFEKEKIRLYEKFGLKIKKYEFDNNRLRTLEAELKQLKKQSILKIRE